MKNLFLTVIIFFAFNSLPAAEKNWEPYIEYLQKELGKNPPPKTTIDSVRESKFSGDNYVHSYQTVISGTGKITKQYSWWPDTTKKINFSHKTTVTLVEKIISTEEEISQGIVKSHFQVIKFNEQFGICKGNASFGILSSNELITDLLALGKEIQKNQGELNKITRPVISFALKVLLNPDPSGMSQSTAAIILATAATVDVSSNFLGWFLGEKLASKTDNEGNLLVSDEDMREKFPDFSNVLFKLRSLEGTKIRTIWTKDTGYTNVDIQTLLKSVTKEDKELIAKIIYRLNPVTARTILPKGKVSKKTWLIDANDFASIFTTIGIDYNKLIGEIRVRNRGTKDDDSFEDEKALGREKVPATTLAIDDNYPNNIIFAKDIELGNKKKNELNVNLKPSGKMLIATAKENEKKAPTYIREVNLTGQFKNLLKKHIEDGSFLLNLDIEESSVDIKSNYSQYRYNDSL